MPPPDTRDRFRFPRLTDQPFPPYRFVPGRDPHPTADPRGHSYVPPGDPEPSVPFVPPERWFESEAYLYGIDLYNHAYWWEAHEAWEALWQLTDKKAPQGYFLQGLIQTAACHLKLFVGQIDGVHRLRGSSSGYLKQVLAAGVGSTFMGLDIPRFLDAVTAYYGPHDSRTAHDPTSYPYLSLDHPDSVREVARIRPPGS